MNKKRVLGILFIMGVIAPSSVYTMDAGPLERSVDLRIHKDGGDQPQWSKDMFKMIDGFCGAVNTPLDTALHKISVWGAKSKFLVTGLLGYFAYRAKDKVVEDVQSAPELISRFVGDRS